MKTKAKKVIKITGIILLALVIVLAAYIIYLYASYHRIPDNQELQVEEISQNTEAGNELTTEKNYSALTYNIGFGAYTPDFSFFMDGGKSSWAKSKDSVKETIKGAGELVASKDPDFALVQEIDLDATRSYHVNEYSILKENIPAYNCVFAQNYDSAFLFYPFTQPHGKSKAGLALFSKYPITGSMRRSFPISTSFTKFFDLDRCYSISRVPVDNGKELVIFELHMSAYGNSDAIREGQIRMLSEDMQKEYEAGNYVICGGDFNHDLKAADTQLKASDADNNTQTGSEDSAEPESWAYPFPRSELPEHFSFCLDQLSEDEKNNLWNSARNADMEYVPGETYTVTLDGFIISDNVECTKYENVNTGYSYSDHDPVYMEFQLKK
ncbi:endonuclease/exonuclease/phosphatase family protein [Blautia luti]|uniref:endonuclease/exonuclease/phosphatase family protein n=1 Tax=Blautia luti TaxID=89014 RepID=UPI001570A8A4|nr:endonuclease/exonuclease/phosphatase family protein [Blautia luti]NSK44485.1 endonuclease/exonuclease/phosphatase family protein [Blautia luti]